MRLEGSPQRSIAAIFELAFGGETPQKRKLCPNLPKPKVCTFNFRAASIQGVIVLGAQLSSNEILMCLGSFGDSRIVKDIEYPIGRRRTNLSRFMCWMAFSSLVYKDSIIYLSRFHTCYKHPEWNMPLCSRHLFYAKSSSELRCFTFESEMIFFTHQIYKP